MNFALEPALKLARRHVQDGARLVDEQVERLMRMTPGSAESRTATQLLATMKATQVIFVADLTRLEEMLP